MKMNEYDEIMVMLVDDIITTTSSLWRNVEGIYDEEMDLKQLKFSKSNNQVLLHTSKALCRLGFIGRYGYDKPIFI
ncbi:hypothetical protein [Clostridium sp.]|uniref:hypothetical protein n=1 Tax=Clostridium sp. TaxID=1506 RepID=UPI002615C034|nr:hypothetical protein [Clostridium sp.]